MIKLLVVDDEIWIRERISKEIPWESVQTEVVGTAEDGQEALEIAEELEPDIIITDIRMPGFDGIELLRELRKKSLDIKVILLSGYNDFSYAKEAIKYGAFDYILKPAEDQELLNVVNRCVMTIEIEREKERRIQGLQEKAELGYEAYKERMLLNIVSGDYEEGEDDRQNEYAGAWKIFQDAIEKVYHTCILVSVAQQMNDPQRRGLEHFIVINIMTEILEKYGVVHKAYLNSRREWLFCLSCGEQKKDEKRLFQDLQMVRNLLEEKLKLDIAIGVGEASDDFFNLAYSYQTVCSFMKYRKWIGDDRIIYHSSNISTAVKTIGRYSTAEMACLLREGRFQQAKETLRRIFETAKKNTPESRIAAICRMISMEAEKEFYQYFKINMGESSANYFQIEFWNGIEEIDCEEKFFELIDRFYKEKKENINKGRRIALKARDYIINHYQKPLSLNDVAEELDLNPSYLCRLFKEEMQTSFVTFLQNYRIEKAAELLSGTNDKIGEIGELVGYENQQYFNKVFRSIKGMAPSEFREKKRGR